MKKLTLFIGALMLVGFTYAGDGGGKKACCKKGDKKEACAKKDGKKACCKDGHAKTEKADKAKA